MLQIHQQKNTATARNVTPDRSTTECPDIISLPSSPFIQDDVVLGNIVAPRSVDTIRVESPIERLSDPPRDINISDPPREINIIEKSYRPQDFNSNVESSKERSLRFLGKNINNIFERIDGCDDPEDENDDDDNGGESSDDGADDDGRFDNSGDEGGEIG